MKSMPDNSWGRERCLQQMTGDHGWNDIPCSDRLRFVCQRNHLDPCAQMHCGNGRCVHHGDGVTSCVCSAGWRGSNCGERIDYCAGVDCGNGRCAATNGVAACVCNAGWTGSRCSQKVDPCAQRPCQNGGDCVSSHDGYDLGEKYSANWHISSFITNITSLYLANEPDIYYQFMLDRLWP